MSFDSSFASEMRDGASERFGTDVSTMTSANFSSSLTRTSYIDLVIERGSM